MASVEPLTPVSVACVGQRDVMDDLAESSPEPLVPDTPVPDEPEKPSGVKTELVNDEVPKDLEKAVSEHDDSEPKDSPKLSEHRLTMERLGRAIDKALETANTVDAATSNQANTSDNRRTINVMFDSGTPFVVPWIACRTWQATEVLLREWFSDDEDALRDISSGTLEVQVMDTEDEIKAWIDPRHWEYVVKNDALINFYMPSVSESSSVSSSQGPRAPDEDGKDADPKAAKEELYATEYQSRIQYSVNFYQTNAQNPGLQNFINRSQYYEPIEFEFANADEKLPALEETKDIISPHSEMLHFRRFEANGKKAKLGLLDRIGDTTLTIHSPFLLNILNSVIEYSGEGQGRHWQGANGGQYFSPFRDLYYHLPELESYKYGSLESREKHSPEFNKKFDEHFELLKTYLESQPNVPLVEARAQWSSKTPVTTFAAYWLLLKPGTDVYVRELDGSLNAYVVHHVSGGVIMENGERKTESYSVHVWNLVYGGKNIFRRLRGIYVPVFDNEREIVEMPIIPVKFIDGDDGGALKQRLIQRGKKYFAYSKGPSFLQYTGNGAKEGTKSYERARIVVEHSSMPWKLNTGPLGDGSAPPAPIPPPPPPGVLPPPDSELSGPDESIPSYDSYHIALALRVPRCVCKECKSKSGPLEVYVKPKFSDYADIRPNKVTTLSDHKFMLMSSHMFAFILKDRVYDVLDVNNIEEPSMAQTAIDSLVMDPSNKELIKAVARTYTDGDQYRRFSADFIQGKGEGQIILLHGPPGTGKTLTAESVAEYTKRPLLSITAADLGHEPDALERSLLRYFKRARDWDAIVLLDEADVYLEQRDPHDLKRNSIVSVFLRALDYFQGILFLTTNRVGQFDEAFMSRIHLSLGYEKLDDEARKKIWDNLFRKLNEDHQRGAPEIKYDYDAKNYVKTKEVQGLEWNGREIRNAFQTAVALAVFDSKQKKTGKPPEMTEDHLRQVVSMSSAFRNYMKATHDGMDDSTRAYKRGNREDKYPNTVARQNQ